MESLLAYSNIVKAVVPIEGTTGHAVTATEVNASGFARCAFLIMTGAMDANCVLECKAQQAATSGGTFANITSAALTNVTSAGASKVYLIDLPVNESYPYLKLAATCGTAQGVFAALAVLYNGVLEPGTDSPTQKVVL